MPAEAAAVHDTLRKRVGPAEAGKAGKVAIRGVQHAAIFDGQSAQVRVGDERAGSLSVIPKDRNRVSGSAVMDEHPRPCLSKTGRDKEGAPS